MDDHAPGEQRLAFYAAKIKEAGANAAGTQDERARQTWLDIAQSWRHLAARVRKDLQLPE